METNHLELEFKEIRKEWKQRKKEEEAQRKAEEERQRAANSAAAAAAAAAIQAPADPTAADGTQPPTTYGGGSRALQLPPIGYQASAYPAPPSATVPQQPLPEYPNSQMYPNYPPPHSPYGQPPQAMYSQCKSSVPQRSASVPRIRLVVTDVLMQRTARNPPAIKGAPQTAGPPRVSPRTLNGTEGFFLYFLLVLPHGITGNGSERETMHASRSHEKGKKLGGGCFYFTWLFVLLKGRG